MELVPKRKLELLSGRSHLALAEAIAAHLGVALSCPNLVDFANGEIRPRFEESVRGADVFIIQSHCRTPGRSVNDSLMEQWLMIDAAKRASAKRITAVCPYYGCTAPARDRKVEGPRADQRPPGLGLLLRRRRQPDHVGRPAHSGQIQGILRRGPCRPPDGGHRFSTRLPAGPAPPPTS